MPYVKVCKRLHVLQMLQRAPNRAEPRFLVEQDRVLRGDLMDASVRAPVVVAWHAREQMMHRVQVETAMKPAVARERQVTATVKNDLNEELVCSWVYQASYPDNNRYTRWVKRSCFFTVAVVWFEKARF